MAVLGEISLTIIGASRVDELSSGEEDELVEESENVGARLMDREDDGSVVGP